ncbi:MAG TPA: response regulator [Candidatus Limnocylindria bacterium]|nr:response regulator [Candidatus Limnocylindria bacterium]
MPGVSGGSRKRVVIAEDDEPIAVLLRDAINDEPGYQAVVVADGTKIEDTVREHHTDLLILDIMMPGLSGFEIYDRLRAHSGTRRMPVLFMSAAVGHFSEDLLRRGITEVVAKPFDLLELLDRVRALCPPAA